MAKELNKIILPIILGKEGRWFVASCPILDIATQGRSEKEVKENLQDLIKLYLNDSDTHKPNFLKIQFPSLSYLEVSLSK